MASVSGNICTWFSSLIQGDIHMCSWKGDWLRKTFRNALESPGICVQGAKGEVAKHPDAVTDCWGSAPASAPASGTLSEFLHLCACASVEWEIFFFLNLRFNLKEKNNKIKDFIESYMENVWNRTWCVKSTIYRTAIFLYYRKFIADHELPRVVPSFLQQTSICVHSGDV